MTDRSITWLRAEGCAWFALSLLLYARLDAGWLLFVLLLLAPDLSMLGYLGGNRLGAASYNACHSYVAPALLGFAGLWGQAPLLLSLALIWSAHVAMDRALGYGLKRATGFQDTHLGRIGRGAGARGGPRALHTDPQA